MPMFDRALLPAPQDPLIHRAMADAMRLQGDELAALAHLIAAQTLEAFIAGAKDASATELCNVGTGYFMKGDNTTAERWYRLALLLDPTLATAYQNLAAIYSTIGQMAEANVFRNRAYQIQRVFIESSGIPIHRVLILSVGGTSGNVPYETLMPTETYCRIKYAIDYASDVEDELLPPYDLVFNAIGEPDVAAAMLNRLSRFVKRCDRPLLNRPSMVTRTQRHRLPDLLRDIDDVVIMPCVRFDSSLFSRAALLEIMGRENIEFPVLARPTATHGGEGLVRYECFEALDIGLRNIPGSSYLTTYYDYKSTDGFYRKYRIIFIDRKPLPYHLAISSNWMVHHVTSDMESSAWKLNEERCFLQLPDNWLGPRATAAITTIGRRLDLDYVGIDFTLLPDGRMFVFEANPSMLVHRERYNGPLAYKNPYVDRIVSSFEGMVITRTSLNLNENARVNSQDAEQRLLRHQ